jgi:ComEC/Rec2-related protein
MVFFLGFVGVIIGILFPEAGIVSSIFFLLFFMKSKWLKVFRFSVLLIVVCSLRVIFLEMPHSGDTCVGYVKKQAVGYVVVSVYGCDTYLFSSVEIYASTGEIRNPGVYTLVNVFVDTTGEWGKVIKGRVVAGSVSESFFMQKYLQVLRFGVKVREELYEKCVSISDSDVASLAVSILFGETHMGMEVKDLMKSLGIVHIMAVSGINIVYLLEFLKFITRKRSYTQKTVLAILVLAVLFVIVGESVSLIRAIEMFLLDVFLRICGLRVKKDRFYVVLSVMLLVSPLLLWSYSFLLVSAACFGVYQVADYFERKYQLRRYGSLGEMATSMLIWLTVVPVQWVLFKEVTWFGGIIGIVIAPIIEIATVIGYVTSLFSIYFSVVLYAYLPIISILIGVLKLFHAYI